MGKLISFMKAMGLVALLFGIFVADGKASDPVIWIHEDINGKHVDYPYKVILRRSSGWQHPHIVYVSDIESGEGKSGSVHFRLFYCNGESVDNGGYVTIDAEGQELIYKCDGIGMDLNIGVGLSEEELRTEIRKNPFLFLFTTAVQLAFVVKAGGDVVIYDMYEVANKKALPDFPLLQFVKFVTDFAQHKAPDSIKAAENNSGY
ncbi:MAG: hypothetical protein LBT67_02400 [Holosporaceae bacterium]|nr:hypothetical protein [Holosporaceae bacterium]